MSEHSIEHGMVFNTARRVLKFVAPDFKAIATEHLKPGQSVLDLRSRTVEVPEGDEYAAAGMIIFSASLLRLRGTPSIVFGDTIDIKGLSDDEAAKAAADHHRLADELAWRWAVEMMTAYFPELELARAEKLADQRQSYDEWLSYFKSRHNK